MPKSSSARAPGDSSGHRRGALGIDDDKDVGFQVRKIDKAAERKMYGTEKDISEVTSEEAK